MKLFIANPSYGPPGPVSMMPQLVLRQRHPDWQIFHFEVSASLLTWGFNAAWCTALNLRAEGKVDHFLLIHQDIRPRDEDWFDVLLAEMEDKNADIISAIVPLKDNGGLTSTALDSDPWTPVRITQAQAAMFDKTWTDPKLLFNTGLMLVDMAGKPKQKHWTQRVCFTINDKIKRGKDGIWRPYVEPEDWNFSRQCRKLGLRCYVTRAVTLDHYGTSRWPSDRVWGSASDMANAPAAKPEFRDPA